MGSRGFGLVSHWSQSELEIENKPALVG